MRQISIRTVLFSCVVLAVVFGAAPMVRAAETTSQSKLTIVLEGVNKSPQQLADICAKHGILVATYDEWKSTLLAASDKVYSPQTTHASRTEVVRKAPLQSFPVSLGSDVVQVTFEESDDRSLLDWKLIVTGRFLWAQRVETGAYSQEEGASNDWAPMAGAGIAFVKGKDAISVSFLGTMDSFNDSMNVSNFMGTFSWDSTYSSRYYYADVRYHRAINNWLSLFVGYKVGYDEWKYKDKPLNGAPYWTEKGRGLGHGPIIGSNVAYSLKGTPLSFYGSFAFMPIGVYHSRVGMRSNGFRDSESSCSAAFFINPEIGVKYHINDNASIGISWLWQVSGTYDDGPSTIIHGPSTSFTYKW